MEHSLEEVARTSDEAAVRAQFDSRNLGWLRFLSIWFGMVGLAETIGGAATGNLVGSVAGAITLVASVAFFRASGRRTPPSPMVLALRRHVSAAAIGFIALQSSMLVAFNSFAGSGGGIRVSVGGGGAVAWAILLPLMMTGFRMVAVELVLLHTVLFVVTLPLAMHDRDAPVIAAFSANCIAISFELAFSRKMRRQTIADWSERRGIAREQLRMRDELRYAREIQLSMLPEAPPPLDWIDVAAVSLPATEVGGDYYDYFLVGRRLAIVSGDVAGHGFASGIVLASLRSGFTLLREGLTEPATVLQRLHSLVGENSRRRTIVTCAVLLLDPETRRATVASAGHPPLVVRRGDGRIERIECFAPPLGVRLPLRVGSTEIPIGSGDVFVLHTDGVYEGRNADEDAYGIERLEAALAEAGSGDAASIRDALVADLARFRADARQDDDITLVVAKVGELS